MHSESVQAESKIIEVIETVYLKGSGVHGDPYRRATAYHHKDGRFITEEDPELERRIRERIEKPECEMCCGAGKLHGGATCIRCNGKGRV